MGLFGKRQIDWSSEAQSGPDYFLLYTSKFTFNMSAHFAPTFRTPLTDLTGGIMTHQSFTKCADFEMRAMECLEAYGVQHGRSKCQDYMDDLRECMFQTKQLARVNVMRQERHRQWIMGERSGENHYAPAARIDGY